MEEKRRPGVVLPVVVDTMPGRDMKISEIEERIHKSPRTNKRPHLLSPMHRDKMQKLPF